MSASCLFALQYGYQDEEERSLNLVEGGRYPPASSRIRGDSPLPPSQDKDDQLLQDLMTLLLSSPAQPMSRHRVTAPHSTSSFFQDLDFPLDYKDYKDFFSQDEKINSQQEQKKGPQKYGEFSGHSGERVLIFFILKSVPTKYLHILAMTSDF